MKRRINMTLEPDVIAGAKHVAAASGRSLSSLVEAQLRRFVATATESDTDDDSHWLDRSHRKYLPQGFVEPTDDDVE